MGNTISVARARNRLFFSIEDDFDVKGAVRFFGRLPHSLPFPYEADRVYFKSEDALWFIRFYLHPTKPRLMIAESSTGAKIDLYFYNPSFEYAVNKAIGAGKTRQMKNGNVSGWGKHVLKNWEIFQRDFEEHGVHFSETSLRKILDAVQQRRTY